MDGNGRWAERRGLPRLAGHRAGVENIRAILRECAELGVEYVTLYAFSTDNWKRPQAEVEGLMTLVEEFIDREGMALHEEGVRIVHLGSMDGVPDHVREKVEWLIDLTRNNDRIVTAVAFNYGGRAEVVAAARAMVADGLRPDEVDEQALALRLFSHDMPDPDLIIRTSGEERLSNFLIWQSAYSEYWTTPVLWPDFRPECLRDAVRDFSLRDRRYGGTTHEGRDAFGSVEKAIEEFAVGKLVLLVDDEDRENEGDLAIGAQFVTPETINFLATHARGLICMPMSGDRLDELGIPFMVPRADGDLSTGFTLSVDSRTCETGISAFDRALTVKALIDPETQACDLEMPGHLFPLRAAEGGLLVRQGHTEAAVEMARLAGCYPASVICEVMNEDGTMARRHDLLTFAARHGITAITVRELVEYTMERASAAS